MNFYQVSCLHQNLQQLYSDNHFRGLEPSTTVLKQHRGIFSRRSATCLFQLIKRCISTEFHASITLYSKVIKAITMEAWELAPSLKIELGGIFSIRSASYLFQLIKMCIYIKFHASITICSKVIIMTIWRPGSQHPSLKIALGGILRKKSESHLFQRIKMCISTNFHASITICSKVIIIPTVEAWSLVPQSKNSIRGHILEGVCILSFSAYQTVYFYQVSCFYHNLHDFFTNSPDQYMLSFYDC